MDNEVSGISKNKRGTNKIKIIKSKIKQNYLKNSNKKLNIFNKMKKLNKNKV